MTTSTRLDIDLAFSLVEPILDDADAESSSNGKSTASSLETETMTGTVTASGTDIEVFSSNPELFLQARSVKVKEARIVAKALAERGLTVSLSGPLGLIARIGAIKPSVAQRVLTGSPHIALGSRAALTPMLRRRNAAAPAGPRMQFPPGTLFPLIPTFDRTIRRKVTTTHYAPGAGRPRLFFVVGSENWNGQMPREFELRSDVTTIGSSSAADLQLPGLDSIHAEIRHDEDDEYVLRSFGAVGGGSRPLTGQEAGSRTLRTGALMEMGQWRIGFFREEYADHGRPFGGRIGGEMGHQKPQPGRHRAEAEPVVLPEGPEVPETR
ncbi:FHA domain-containing protein [Salinibacterium sp. UTAS2018]|uniref:FHA domain-containing protein n=1 Tax=Salinibacterium sp. UTAS2018 TaxID=2508880 RepID=UPI001AF01C24|nr:FHA domain-containing protein [Salinibacterium sp. UTAS2018]